MIWRILLTLTAGVGAIAGLVLSVQHLQTGETCPQLGSVPACYLVFAGYVLVLTSAWLPIRRAAWAFWMGWTPIASLASAGTVFELVEGNVCPRTDSGIPQCFISLGIAIALLVLWLALDQHSKRLRHQS